MLRRSGDALSRAVRRQREHAEPHRARRAHPPRGRSAAQRVGRVRSAARSGSRRGPRRDRPAHGVPPSLRRLRRNAAGDRRADVAHPSDAARPVPRYRASDLRRRRSGRRHRRATRDRIWHVHFKDCEPSSLRRRGRTEGWDYHTAVRRGMFCELGRGMVPFRRVLRRARARRLRRLDRRRAGRAAGSRHAGASAARNREYLRRLGI